jgi:hypothetical protein
MGGYFIASRCVGNSGYPSNRPRASPLKIGVGYGHKGLIVPINPLVVQTTEKQ